MSKDEALLARLVDSHQWEYLWALPLDGDDLDALGAIGWEAVGMSYRVRSDSNGDIQSEPTVLMKRPIARLCAEDTR